MNRTQLFRLSRMLVAFAMVGLLSSCRLSQPASASFASVVIVDRSAADIQTAAVAVFTAAGYQTMFITDNEFVFEKEGTRANEIARGGWIENTGVRERVRAELILLSPGRHRLQCQVYMVSHPGDAVFQDEVRLRNFRGRPYQHLLDEVAARLK